MILIRHPLRLEDYMRQIAIQPEGFAMAENLATRDSVTAIGLCAGFTQKVGAPSLRDVSQFLSITYKRSDG